ncbi:hypothetical protein [Corynebacterium freiburgense]|uniref:hypothetical protein n=1 Tax=Corynebacterium freiburgense TaxID=556548 RepID=UPI00042581C0|nr:hypothetical protein [Corynebacterium freiburgense]WJZ02613.1 hypothetical protein CFREI_06635 [Corynebacterium freiburgense]
MKKISDFAVANVTLSVEDWEGRFTVHKDGESRQTKIGDWELSAADVASVLATIPGVDNPTERWWVLAPKESSREATLYLLHSYPFSNAKYLTQLHLGRETSAYQVRIDGTPKEGAEGSLDVDSWTPQDYESEIEDAGYAIASLWIVKPVVDMATHHRELVCEALSSPLNPEDWLPIWS